MNIYLHFCLRYGCISRCGPSIVQRSTTPKYPGQPSCISRWDRPLKKLGWTSPPSPERLKAGNFQRRVGRMGARRLTRPNWFGSLLPPLRTRSNRCSRAIPSWTDGQRTRLSAYNWKPLPSACNWKPRHSASGIRMRRYATCGTAWIPKARNVESSR